MILTPRSQNILKAKELLKSFKELWTDQLSDNHLNHSSKLAEIATQLATMKLADQFLISDLSEEEQTLLKDKVYVLIHF